MGLQSSGLEVRALPGALLLVGRMRCPVERKRTRRKLNRIERGSTKPEGGGSIPPRRAGLSPEGRGPHELSVTVILVPGLVYVRKAQPELVPAPVSKTGERLVPARGSTPPPSADPNSRKRGGAVDRTALLTRRAPQGAPRVRIPPLPPVCFPVVRRVVVRRFPVPFQESVMSKEFV